MFSLAWSYNHAGVLKSLRHAYKVAFWVKRMQLYFIFLFCQLRKACGNLSFICDVHSGRRKIRIIEVNAKCCHLKKLTCKGTLRQVFIIVYRLVFSTQLCDLYSPLLPLSPSLWFNFPPFPARISVMYTSIQCVRKGGADNGVLGLRQINTCRNPFAGNFFR